MSPQFFHNYFPIMQLNDADFFSIWCLNFSGQLKKLHEELVVEDENGEMANFQGMNFEDFCILTYQQRPDLISYTQN